jgi:electron transport complex protein RnfG
MKMVFKSVFNWATGLAGLACLWGFGAGFCNPACAKDFWSTQGLLSSHFHGSERVSYVRVHLDAAQRKRIESRLGRALPKDDYTFFVASSQGRTDGYALFDDQLGQHEPISFATFFDAEGRIQRVEVVAYREPYGDAIRAERFRQQFVGRSGQSQFRAGADIDAISGATISSRSMCVGVERAAAIFDEAIRHNASAALALR